MMEKSSILNGKVLRVGIFAIIFLPAFPLFFQSFAKRPSAVLEDEKIVYVYDGEIVEEKIAELIRKVKGDEKIKNFVFSKTDSTALHIIIFEKGGEEKLHYHQKSDLFVVVLKGKGEIIVEGKKFNLSQGDFVFIQKGKKHKFINTENGQTFVFVVSSPPLEKDDRHFVE